MGILAIYITLVHQRKSHAVLLVYHRFYFLIWVWFLVVELVAWKGNNFEPLRGVFSVHLNQSEIVLLREGSV